MLDPLPHALGIEAGKQLARGAGVERRAQRVEDAVQVMQRQHVQQVVGRAELPGLHERTDLRLEDRVRREDALGLAGRAARVEDHGPAVCGHLRQLAGLLRREARRLRRSVGRAASRSARAAPRMWRGPRSAKRRSLRWCSRARAPGAWCTAGPRYRPRARCPTARRRSRFRAASGTPPVRPRGRAPLRARREPHPRCDRAAPRR